MSPTPEFFRSQAEFRKWLEKNHTKVDELWIGYFKKASGKGGLVYKQALDEALCFGWIDGVVNRVDADSYKQRWTPRRDKSIWSNINIKRATELRDAGLMAPAGLAAFEARDAKRSGVYSFENRPKTLDAARAKTLRANKKAWTFFEAQPPGYKRLMIWRVMSAKQDATRDRRLDQLIKASAAGKRMDLLTGAPTKAGSRRLRR
jgi:uncharacterized protein YdeI (YjbR/CyaY-like superfamily)